MAPEEIRKERRIVGVKETAAAKSTNRKGGGGRGGKQREGCSGRNKGKQKKS